MLRFKLNLFFCLPLLFFFTPSVLADATGFWACKFTHQKTVYPQNLSLQQSGEIVTGSVFPPGSASPFAVATGSITGDKVQMNFNYIASSQKGEVSGVYLGNSGSGIWTSNTNQNGTFICDRTDAGFLPPPQSDASVRKTSLSLFCNRGGLGLSTATCTATVGDIGAPPRSTPTGTVQFIAFGGFLPESSVCNLSQTPLSPGVSSCVAQFQIPTGFPIGAAFPIDAVYNAGTNFVPSASSHQLISAGCIGTPESPCSGAVAIGFVDAPKVAKNLLTTVISCGGTTTNARRANSEAAPRKEPTKDKCDVVVSVKTTPGKVLAEASISDMDDVAKQILKDLGAKGFTSDERNRLKIIAEVSNELYAHEQTNQLQGAFSNLSKEELANQIDSVVTESSRRSDLNKKLDPSKIVESVFNEAVIKIEKRSQRTAVSLRAKVKTKSAEQIVATGEIQVLTNAQQNLKLKMNRWFSVLLSASQKGQANSVPLSLNVSSSRIGKVPAGARRKVSFSQQISAFIASR